VEKVYFKISGKIKPKKSIIPIIVYVKIFIFTNKNALGDK
jgi:hypothetical protein